MDVRHELRYLLKNKTFYSWWPITENIAVHETKFNRYQCYIVATFLCYPCTFNPNGWYLLVPWYPLSVSSKVGSCAGSGSWLLRPARTIPGGGRASQSHRIRTEGFHPYVLGWGPYALEWNGKSVPYKTILTLSCISLGECSALEILPNRVNC